MKLASSSRWIFVALTTLGCAGGSEAQSTGSAAEHRAWLQITVFRPNFDTSMRIDDPSNGLDGTLIDLEQHAGLPKRKTAGAALLGARWGERWRAEVEHFALKRETRDFRVDRQITVDDTTFAATASLDTRFDITVTRASLGYSLLRSSDVEMGVAAGVHVSRFRFDVAGQATVGGVVTNRATESSSGTAPLPTLGVYGNWGFGPAWSASGRADYFSLHHGGYDGRLITMQAEVAHRFNPSWSLGLGYRIVDYRLNAERSNLNGQIDVRFHGPQLTLRAGF